jgi:hypothetical protein
METITTQQVINAQELAFDDLLDEVEKAILQSPDVILSVPVENLFTDGLYMRRVKLQKGSLVTSKVHKTQNPFMIMKGSVLVWDAGCSEASLINAPYVGITEPNTRRMVYVVDDCDWITCHPNHENLDLKSMEEKIFGVHVNKLLNKEMADRLEACKKEADMKSTTIDKRTIKQIKF